MQTQKILGESRVYVMNSEGFVRVSFSRVTFLTKLKCFHHLDKGPQKKEEKKVLLICSPQPTYSSLSQV